MSQIKIRGLLSTLAVVGVATSAFASDQTAANRRASDTGIASSATSAAGVQTRGINGTGVVETRGINGTGVVETRGINGTGFIQTR